MYLVAAKLENFAPSPLLAAADTPLQISALPGFSVVFNHTPRAHDTQEP